MSPTKRAILITRVRESWIFRSPTPFAPVEMINVIKTINTSQGTIFFVAKRGL